jgi:DNA-binding NtrC family response regulator
MNYHEAKAKFEREFVERALAEADGNRKKAAENAGMNRSHFYKLLRRSGIDSPRRGSHGNRGNAAWQSLR